MASAAGYTYPRQQRRCRKRSVWGQDGEYGQKRCGAEAPDAGDCWLDLDWDGVLVRRILMSGNYGTGLGLGLGRRLVKGADLNGTGHATGGETG